MVDNKLPMQAPPNTVIGIIRTETDKSSLAENLAEAGFHGETVIQVFHGEKGLKMIDPDGSEHGLVAKMWRGIQKMVSETDHVTLEAIQEALGNGEYVVAVSIDGSKAERDKVHSIMKENGGSRVFASYPGAIELLSGWDDFKHDHH